MARFRSTGRPRSVRGTNNRSAHRPSTSHPTDSERFRLTLYHHHLPKLAEGGYVRWESDPFAVRRGPNFDEPAFVVSQLTGSTHRYPSRLREEFTVIGDVEVSGPEEC
jgi:hypothetical protein